MDHVLTLLFAAARRRTSSKSVLLTEAQKQLMVHKLPQVLRLHLKRFRYDDVPPESVSVDNSIHSARTVVHINSLTMSVLDEKSLTSTSCVVISWKHFINSVIKSAYACFICPILPCAALPMTVVNQKVKQTVARTGCQVVFIN